MRGGGTALKFLSLFFRLIEFCCAAVILGLFSFFLADLSKNNRPIPTYEKAVEGISGVAVIYTALAFIFVCCLGGIAFFSLLAILLDLACCGAFIYVAWAARGGVRGDSGRICTPLGCGDAQADVPRSSIRFRTAHRLETAVFAVAVIGAVLFFLNAFVEFGLMRHHKKEKAFGPGPNNGYTAGSRKPKFWQRGRKRDVELAGGLGAAKVHPDALPAHTHPADVRTSYATDATAVEQTPFNKYGHTAPVGQPGYVAPAAHHTPYAQQSGYAQGTTEMPAGNYHASSNSNGTF